MAGKLDEIKRAVALSFELAASAPGDPERDKLREDVTQYLRELELSPDAWRFGLELFLSGEDEYARFYGISRVSSTLEDQHRAAQLSADQLRTVREAMLQWAESGALAAEKLHLRNKAAVVVSLLVKREYPGAWPDAFAKLLALANKDSAGARLFLKVLDYITEEVVAAPSGRDEDDRQRGTEVKDALRMGPLKDIMHFMYQVLTNCAESDPRLVHRCLAVLRDYISWIDINLIVNEQIMPAFSRFLSQATEFRVDVLLCLSEVVRKGMDFESKVRLVQSMDLCGMLKRICEADKGGAANTSGGGGGGGEADDDNESDDDDEHESFRTAVAGLVRDIGAQFVAARLSMPSESPVHALVLEELSGKIIPLALFECLGRPEQEAQTTILEFVSRMVSVVREHVEADMEQGCNSMVSRGMNKRATPLRPVDTELDRIFRAALPEILPLIVRNMCYPADYTFDRSDEDEVEFGELRQAYRNVFVNIVRCAATETALPFMQNAVRETLDPAQIHSRHPFQVEVILSLLYAFREGTATLKKTSVLHTAKLGNAHVGKLQKDSQGVSNAPPANNLDKAAAEDARRAELRVKLAELVAATHRCQFWNYPEPHVVLVYNELTVQSAGLLREFNPEMVGPVLEGLAGPGGLQHQDSTVRAQSCYLLPKLVKALDQTVKPFAGGLFSLLQPHLVVTYDAVLYDVVQEELQAAELAGAPAVPSQCAQPIYSVADSMCLFELASVLLALDKDADPALITEQVLRVMGPVHNKLEEIIANVPPGTGGPDEARQRRVLGNWAAESVHALSSLSKALSSMPRAGELLGGSFKAALDAALRALDAMPENDLLRKRITAMLHCILGILGEEAFSFAPDIGVRLLEQSQTLEDVLPAMQFINQVVVTFKSKMREPLERALVRIVSHVVNVMGSVRDPFVDMPEAPVETSARAAKLRRAGLGALTSEQVDFRSAKRALLSFFCVVVENELHMVLLAGANRQLLEQVLNFCVDTLATFPDPIAQKHSLRLLHALVTAWLPRDRDAGLDSGVREAFAGLVMERATLASLQATTVRGFSMLDAGCVDLLDKVCRFHLTLLAHFGEPWLHQLVERTLPSINCPPALAREYASAVAEPEQTSKALRKHFARLFLS